MDGMRSVLTVSEKQMEEWKAICKEYANSVGAILLFVNDTSCGIEYPDGLMVHLSIDELVEIFGGKVNG